MIDGITYIENFITNPETLFEYLKQNIVWDESMMARKTASFGVAYNYSQIHYPFVVMPENLASIIIEIEKNLGFKPNNCLVNYYLDGKSTMGYHSDQTDILVENTGIAIVSLGETRILRFRNITNKEEIVDYILPAGSLIYMTQEVQNYWQHAIPKTAAENGRMSLTLRMIN
jgi:alkylated DNA repair dioxygenase AlkB